MTATRERHFTKQTPAREVLFLAFELGWNEGGKFNGTQLEVRRAKAMVF